MESRGRNQGCSKVSFLFLTFKCMLSASPELPSVPGTSAYNLLRKEKCCVSRSLCNCVRFQNAPTMHRGSESLLMTQKNRQLPESALQRQNLLASFHLSAEDTATSSEKKTGEKRSCAIEACFYGIFTFMMNQFQMRCYR